MADLLPCPFCGGSDVMAVDENCDDGEHPPLWVVACECGARGPDGDTKRQAIAAWNRRTDDPARDAKEADRG